MRTRFTLQALRALETGPRLYQSSLRYAKIFEERRGERGPRIGFIRSPEGAWILGFFCPFRRQFKPKERF